MEGGGLRVEGGAWRVEGARWRVQGGGWRVKGGGWGKRWREESGGWRVEGERWRVEGGGYRSSLITQNGFGAERTTLDLDWTSIACTSTSFSTRVILRARTEGNPGIEKRGTR